MTARWKVALLPLVGLVLPAVAVFGVLYRQALPVPCQNDYGTILAFAVSFAIGSRYSSYSTLTLIFCYSFLGRYVPNRWPAWSRKRFYLASLATAVAVCLFADANAYQKLGARHQMVLAGIENYRINPKVSSAMMDRSLLDQNLPRGFRGEQAYAQRA